MFNGMAMDPEMFRIAQEQMGRMSPQEMAKIQQQMLSNPDLMRLASESMKNMRPEDIKMAAEQLKHVRPQDMAEMGEKISKASPDEIAIMHAQAEAQASYELNAVQMLKQQGNELHSRGKFHEAAEKYLRAKNNLNGIPLSKCRILQTQCSLNLMSCYLKTGKFRECIEEGSQVLAYDPMNVKALYRRGHAYKETENLEAAVSDLRKAHETSPDDETIADAWRNANDKFMKADAGQSRPRGVIIEEIVDDDDIEPSAESVTSRVDQPSAESVTSRVDQPSADCISPTPVVNNRPNSSSLPENGSSGDAVRNENEYLNSLKDDPQSLRFFQEYIANISPESMATFGASGMPPEMIKATRDMIKDMKPEDLQKMLQLASSTNMKNPINPTTSTDNKTSGARMGSHFPEMTPEMMSMAQERLKKMSPEELQKMVEAASSLDMNNSPFSKTTPSLRGGGSEMTHQSSTMGRFANEDPFKVGNSRTDSQDSAVGPSSCNNPASTADLQETMRNSMRDPAMRQMFSSMMKSMNPEMMASMGEQFGFKLSKEEAAKAQQAMSSLSPDDLEKMMRWVERAQKGVETARKTKNWLLGKPGMILAICMLILAVILHRLGFIGG